MRVTSSMYYKSLYGENNSQLNNKLFDVNKQIASRLKIQYAKDGVSVFTETMRLDNEIVTLKQIKKSTESGYKVSNQTDIVLNEFEDSMNRMRTLLLQAANGTNDEVSLNAVASELRGIEEHFKNLANTSINGKHLFSGSTVDIKPISADGTYNGNNMAMKAFSGLNVQQQYNLTGAELFLGEEVLTRREVTSNVIQAANASTSTVVAGDSTMSQFMGDVNSPNEHYFYLTGVKNNGTAFKQQIPMTDTETVDDLLTKIGNAYGNTPSVKVVNVSLNSSGQIVVEDKMKASSKLDFHLVGATDFSGGGAANVTSIDNLDSGSTDYASIIATPGLYVREFVKSPYGSAAAGITNIDGLLYDRTQFSVSGNTVSSDVSQIMKTTNAFATPSTKISEVADVSQGTAGTLDGTQFKLAGTNVNGIAFDVQIDFKNTAGGGSTFSPDGGITNYKIFNIEVPRAAVDADKMTYQQLMDVINMVVTNQFPATTNTDTDYDTTVSSSNFAGTTSLSYDGKIKFGDLSAANTKATIALYDSNSGDFTAGADASVMSFNSNNALTIRDPKTDFFKSINEMITAVENYKLYPDSKSGDIRNIGMENSIARMDSLQDHVFGAHSLVGAQSNALTLSIERTQLLEVSTMTLRSSVIDTDLAEASLALTQLTLNYEAMLSTVGRVSKLSLVNYL
ncbi:flagellar biosynthesis protein FlgL [bacterium]|nr:flagellar biosynthesis protein FlgL [bacterium]MBU1994297.1 flagellar biosynthesis protein FlgL [bacterium]